MIIARRDMLTEYFSLNISESGLVQSIPLLLRDCIDEASATSMPLFL